MRGLVYLGPDKLEVQEIADVSPKAGEVKIAVKACGICGSDVHGYLGLTGRRTPPMVMGHEFSGEIVEVGEGVKNLKVGDRVAPYPVDYCENCEMCAQGNYHLCANKRQFGVLTVDGAFADYICVPEKVCFKINDDVSFDIASLMEPFAVANHGVDRAGDLAGKTVMLVGTGTIGLLALVCIKIKNPAKILVSDLSDFRLDIAKKLGADIVINPTTTDFKQAVLDATDGKGVDVSYEAVGAAPSVQSAMAALKFGGLAVWIGNNKPMIEINMQEIVTRELKVVGSFLYTLHDFETVIDVINEKSVDLSSIISVCAPLEEAADYFYKLAHDPGTLVKVIINP